MHSMLTSIACVNLQGLGGEACFWALVLVTDERQLQGGQLVFICNKLPILVLYKGAGHPLIPYGLFKSEQVVPRP